MRFPRDPALTDSAIPWQMRERRGGSALNFEEILDQALPVLPRRGRVTYHTLVEQRDERWWEAEVYRQCGVKPGSRTSGRHYCCGMSVACHATIRHCPSLFTNTFV
jgi:hypothetical protein